MEVRNGIDCSIRLLKERSPIYGLKRRVKQLSEESCVDHIGKLHIHIQARREAICYSSDTSKHHKQVTLIFSRSCEYGVAIILTSKGHRVRFTRIKQNVIQIYGRSEYFSWRCSLSLNSVLFSMNTKILFFAFIGFSF